MKSSVTRPRMTSGTDCAAAGAAAVTRVQATSTALDMMAPA
jgi:hypothetical protein